ncbi:predicted protein [Streptomyces filamentosus NRRL 15998]|uniref:Predicted protein n=1 Tax=Streptomyces filamentosus NRRL 15998 TaxID=457431 RepID=D6ASV9_STRFL|nr:predicted protein [Streptomyces filamentosus NRRL 15998]
MTLLRRPDAGGTPVERPQSIANSVHRVHFLAKLTDTGRARIARVPKGQCWTSGYLCVYMWMH